MVGPFYNRRTRRESRGMFRVTALRRLAVLTVLELLVLALPVVTTTAQPAPVQVIQSSDGTVYLAQGTNAWTMVPNAISDAELAGLTPSGELDGAIPAPFLSASELLAPLQAVQDTSGALYLVQGGNVWILVPTQVSDADLAGLSIVGQIGGEISAPALSVPNAPVDAAPPPVAVAPPLQPVPAQANVSAVGNPNGTIKIVSSLPRDGNSKSQTDSIVNAFRMALDEVQNTAGGATIMYQDVDGGTPSRGDWDAAKESENASLVLRDPDVMVYIEGASGSDLNAPGRFGGSLGGPAKVSIPILCPASLGMISPANPHAGLTKNIPGATAPGEPDIYYYGGCKRNYTRVVPSDDIQAAAAARWSKDLGATRAYVLFGVDGGMAAVYAATAPKVGLRLVGGPEGIYPQAGDYRALAQKIRQSGADVVFFDSDVLSDAATLWRDLRATLGTSVKLMGSNGLFNHEFIDAAGPVAEGTYTVSASIPANKLRGAGAQWYANYKARFNTEPSGYAIYGYESMKVALDAIQRAGKKDRGVVRDAIFSTRNFDGALGRWSFTDTGDTTLTTVYGRQVRNGRFDDANAVALQAP
jgi:branched-chain amino acid transport system substrate-binding protein